MAILPFILSNCFNFLNNVFFASVLNVVGNITKKVSIDPKTKTLAVKKISFSIQKFLNYG